MTQVEADVHVYSSPINVLIAPSVLMKDSSLRRNGVHA
jgi:hypothetical protein